MSGTRGTAATAHPLATRAALDVFAAGGNAIDAAVAAAWALAVCEPSNSGLGGQTILLLRRAPTDPLHPAAGPPVVIDGHSRAPAAASLDTITRRQQRSGHRATTVPTTPLVLEAARQRYGRLPLAQVMGPAIRLAAEGIPVTPLFRKQVRWCLKALRNSPSASRLFLNGDRPHDVNAWLRQPALAGTLERMADFGVEDFYHGRLARQIADDMRANGGLLTLEDLAAVDAPVVRDPIEAGYRGCSVVTVPPPGGGLQILLGLKFLERCGFDPRDLGAWYAMLGEATWAVFRERDRAAGLDPAERLADARIERLLAEVRTSCRPADEAADAGFGPAAEEPGETTHLCTADDAGNVVSLTQSIQSLFGARVACSPCGFLWNNYLATCPRQAHPSQLGPSCRPRSNAAPTILGLPSAAQAGGTGLAAAGGILALGGAGSRRTTSAILHTISAVVDRGLSLADAVAAPRLHVKLSRGAWLERAAETESILPQLAERFRSVQVRSRYSYAMGCVQSIQIGADGRPLGAADPRREGTAGVFPETGS